MSICYKSPAALVRAVRIALANPGMRFTVPGNFPLTSAEVLANFKSGLMKRCNRGLNTVDEQRYQDLRHDARIINDAAMRIRWPGRNLLRTPVMIRRYSHIHNPPVEY